MFIILSEHRIALRVLCVIIITGRAYRTQIAYARI